MRQLPLPIVATAWHCTACLGPGFHEDECPVFQRRMAVWLDVLRARRIRR